MGFYGRLTFLGRFIIMGIIVAAIGCALYFSGLTQKGADMIESSKKEKVENVVEKTADAVEDAAEKTVDAVENTAEKVADAVEEAAK